MASIILYYYLHEYWPIQSYKNILHKGMDMENILDDLQKVFTILAIVIGGLWAYFNFFKSRVYRVRVEPMISGKVFDKDGKTHLIVKLQLKNAGLSKVDIQHKGTGFRVFTYKEKGQNPDTQPVESERLGTFPIFEDHGWIESGETIVEEQLVSIQNGHHFAFLLELRIVAHRVSFKTKSVVFI